MNSSGLAQNYRQYVLAWLTGADIGQSSVWHSKLALNEQSWPIFKAKAIAIFNEHLLGIRLRAQGTRVLDVTWLATQLESQNRDNIDWNRWWKDQLAERDSDQLVIK